MALEAGILTVTLEYGKDLKNKEWFGKQDPYCKLRCGVQEFRTKTCVDGGTAPVWNEKFNFNVINENTLDVTIMDEDTSSDDLIGTAIISFARAREQGRDHVQVPVQSKSGKQHGFISVMLEFAANNALRSHVPPTHQQPVYGAPPYGYPPAPAGYPPAPLMMQGYHTAPPAPSYGQPHMMPPVAASAPPAHDAMAALTHERDTLKASLESKDAENVALKADLAEMRQQLDKANSTISSLKSKIRKLQESEKDKLAAEEAKLHEKLAELALQRKAVQQAMQSDH